MPVHETRFHASVMQFGKEVSPCPFCGSTHLRVYMGPQPHVCCMQCAADGPLAPRKSDGAGPYIAIDLWNRAATRKEMAEGDATVSPP